MGRMFGPPDQETALAIREAVLRAAREPEVGRVVAEVYAGLQAAIDQRRPVCAVSGRCCRFEEYGHRLFVSTLELAAFVAGLGAMGDGDRERIAKGMADWDNTGCPFQIARLCGVHAARPFGCRIYFCDPTAQEWQQDVYERTHARLKAEHERLGVPYYYLEWRQALRVVMGDPPSLDGVLGARGHPGGTERR
jgi:hypothetical protein